MQLQPGVLVIAGILSLALLVLPLGLPLWGRLAAAGDDAGLAGADRHPFPPDAASLSRVRSGRLRHARSRPRELRRHAGRPRVARLRGGRQAAADQQRKGMAGFVQLLEQPNSSAVCSRLVIADPASDELRADLVVFLTERTAGPTLVTSNSTIIVPFPPNPRFDTVWFPDVRDPAKLYALHEARVAQPGAGVPRRTTVASDPVDYQRRLETASKEHMVRCGYWWLEEDNRVYRPTWKGAILMAWRLLPPFRQLIRWQRTRRAAAVAPSLARRVS